MVSDAAAMTVSGRPHQAADIRSISEQILSGLDFLHALGIIHCVQTYNPQISYSQWSGLRTVKYSTASKVKSQGTIVDDSAPQYLMPTQRPRGQLDDADFSKLCVKICDLGGHEQKPVTPTALRAPELIRRNTWDAGIDIWALGVIVDCVTCLSLSDHLNHHSMLLYIYTWTAI
ncbi:LOW QUALITY PROTEIN: serine protein kinase [Aspergillus lentulus]|nr:LOW QUALITY PROTEIN: serine protein kinase [Aspergillus lentulus]